MIEKTNEKVRVFVDFIPQEGKRGPTVRPVAFLRGGRRYVVERVNFVSEAGVGPTKRFYFSVSDAANSFTLEYNPFDLSWTMKELFVEG